MLELMLYCGHWLGSGKRKWDNRHFQVYLRLALNGLPVAARMGPSGRPCPCGVCWPDRRHHFWECPVAKAVLWLEQAAAIRVQDMGAVCGKDKWATALLRAQARDRHVGSSSKQDCFGKQQ